MSGKRTIAISLANVAGLLCVAAVLWPSHAWAWGPLAHLDFSSGALSLAAAFSPATRLLLSQYASEFLYGSLAADIIVGKNLARYAVHCHNWTVGFRVLDRAKGDPQKAFSLGFLAHLSADTVAHNYYIPYKTVQGYAQRAAGHAYWELRYDQRLSSELWKVARHVSQAEFREHDEHLEECLSESYVVPFALSKKLFGGLLLAARLRKWQRMSEVLAAERDMSLQEEEVRECRKLAVAQITGMLRDGTDAACTAADPTGGRNLHVAADLRKRLRANRELPEREAREVVRSARPAFREAIFGRLTPPVVP
jgi:hypothetical protein